MFTNKSVRLASISVGVFIVIGVLAFEPITRNVTAVDDVCSYCHVDMEYRSDVRLAFSNAHPLPETDVAETETVAAETETVAAETETVAAETKPKAQVTCAECHLPPGTINAVYAYTHFASLTDLFGHFRHRTSERAGAWIPPRQAAAHRVRDRMFEYDSNCRTCHVEKDIVPKRERGKNAHKKALDEQKACIECHFNEKHRSVDVRENAFAQATGK